jgi:hypothetical protein
MEPALVTGGYTTATAIWGRIVRPERATLAPGPARFLPKLDFDAEDHHRVEWLSDRAKDGSLTPEQRAELDEW